MINKVKKEVEALVQREVEDYEIYKIFVKELFGSRRKALEYISQLRGENNDNSEASIRQFEYEFDFLSKVEE